MLRHLDRSAAKWRDLHWPLLLLLPLLLLFFLSFPKGICFFFCRCLFHRISRGFSLLNSTSAKMASALDHHHEQPKIRMSTPPRTKKLQTPYAH
jgi:hypothetical protein